MIQLNVAMQWIFCTLTMMWWVLESRWKRKARNSVIPTIPANLCCYAFCFVYNMCKIQKLTYDGCCVLLTEASSPDAAAPWAWSPCAASAARVSLALESPASDIKLLTFTCHHSHEGRYLTLLRSVGHSGRQGYGGKYAEIVKNHEKQ